MRQVFLYMFLFCAVAFCFNANGRLYIPVEKNAGTYNTCEAKQYTDHSIEACVAANSYAQTSVENNLTFNGGLMRRCRLYGALSDDVLIAAKNFAEVNAYKHIRYTSLEYGARQKLAGYYIYALRKIII